MRLNERLKVMLKVKGVKQKVFAKEIKVNECVVSRWLKGVNQPKLRYLNKICDFFGCSLDVLMGNDKFVEKMLEQRKEEDTAK